jgi:hypothetical protein
MTPFGPAHAAMSDSTCEFWRQPCLGKDFQGFVWPAPRADSLMRREADEFSLLREMNHCLPNTLALLTGVLRHELASPELPNALAHCEERIVASGSLGGATARTMLVSATAKRWNVDSASRRAQSGEVLHTRTGRRIKLGELVADSARLPIPENVAPQTCFHCFRYPTMLLGRRFCWSQHRSAF